MLVLMILAVLQAQEASVVEELQRIEQQLATTWQAGDCAGWGAMLHPEWSVIHITGETITKEQALVMCKAPRTAPVAMNITEVSVRVFGDSAVVTGRTTVQTRDDAAATVVLRFTDVFVRHGGRWQVVASQATRLSTSANRQR
jgi:Domain of unknown function (DUF4440)